MSKRVEAYFNSRKELIDATTLVCYRTFENKHLVALLGALQEAGEIIGSQDQTGIMTLAKNLMNMPALFTASFAELNAIWEKCFNDMLEEIDDWDVAEKQELLMLMMKHQFEVGVV